MSVVTKEALQTKSEMAQNSVQVKLKSAAQSLSVDPVEHVAEQVRKLTYQQKIRLLHLVPEIQNVNLADWEVTREQKELADWIDGMIQEHAPDVQPAPQDAPFLYGLTMDEYFSLPDKVQELLWDMAHRDEMEKLEGYEHPVRPDALPAGQKCCP